MEYRYFTDEELRNGQTIPEGLENNIRPTAKVLDELRHIYGKPIFVNSTYRSPEYNKFVGGKKNSLHLDYNAIDFSIKDIPKLKDLYALLEEWDRNHRFDFLPKPGSMGLGLYKSFIHIDTRATLGRKAPSRWNG